MSFQRRAYDMDLGRRDHTRWLGSNRYAGSGPVPVVENAILLSGDEEGFYVAFSGDQAGYYEQTSGDQRG